jgi:hypothetical protein
MAIESFSQFRDVLREETRADFLSIKKHRAAETNYAFSLVTSDDAHGVSAVANTEEAYAALLARRPSKTWWERNVFGPAMRWSPEEWPTNYSAPIPDIDSQELNTPDQEFDPTYGKRLLLEACPSREEFRSKAFRAMADALRLLDEEGIFGKGKDREQITLFLSISDADEEGLLELESARLLNPRRSAQRLACAYPLPIRWINSLVYFFWWLRKGRIIARRL